MIVNEEKIKVTKQMKSTAITSPLLSSPLVPLPVYCETSKTTLHLHGRRRVFFPFMVRTIRRRCVVHQLSRSLLCTLCYSKMDVKVKCMVQQCIPRIKPASSLLSQSKTSGMRSRWSSNAIPTFSLLRNLL